jgi:ketosteroid isomerase-like protein
MDDLQDFERFMRRRGDVAHAYVNGDAAPLSEITTHALPATFFGPQGGYREGAHEVSSTYEHDAGAFKPGGDSNLTILQMAASGDIAYWVGFQHAHAKLGEQDEPVPMELRVSEVFRREGGEWKLVHRHADMLKAKAPKKN